MVSWSKPSGGAAVMVLGGVAVSCAIGVAFATGLWDRIKVQTECAYLQLKELGNTGGSLLSWPETQYHIFCVLGIEANRRREYYQNLRAGISEFKAGLPHVNTANSSAADDEKMKKMMMEAKQQPILKQLVLIGGGHTHAFVLKMAGMKPIAGVRIVLITRDVMTPYSGMLPGHVAGMYTRDECHIDLVRLGEFAGVSVVHAEAVNIDRKSKLVELGNGQPPIPYDVLSIDIGCTPMTGGIEEKTSGITKVKPIDGFAARWDALLERVVKSDPKEPIQVVVVGGGAGGVELACSMQLRIENELKIIGKSTNHVSFSLVTRGDKILSSHNDEVQAAFARIMGERKIAIRFNCEVVSARNKEGGGGGGVLICEDGATVDYDECIWCTSAGAAPWLAKTGLRLDTRGFIEVNDYLQSTNDDCVFAAGDCAHMRNFPRPKAGVFAVRAGPPLNQNLRRKLAGQELVAYEPQSRFLGIIGTGSKESCVASKGTMCLQGAYLWQLKDWIDRKWMADYTTALAEKKKAMMDKMKMDTPSAATGKEALAILQESVMRCGGCGSKVSLPSEEGKAVVHTVDFFRSFIADPYVFGKIAANHALSDCHAMGADTVSALAVVVIPYATSKVMEDMLYRVMAGACEVLKESGCALVGGHTCEGPELALGFAVNGYVDAKRVMKKAGMKEDQLLILTKPVGTGTLFAANMRCEAFGRDVAAALDTMCQSNKRAGEILMESGARACTDVTGFGVLGHLHEMTHASAVGAEINLDKVPFLSGAVECVRKGIFSSLHSDNARMRKIVEVDAKLVKDERYALLFDPQTAGGLLASVPRSNGPKCIKALKDAGYRKATVVGRITKGNVIKVV